ncbi:hypothetical protein J6590_033716, partial [Homalodisca vitripennis]
FANYKANTRQGEEGDRSLEGCWGVVGLPDCNYLADYHGHERVSGRDSYGHRAHNAK